MSVTLWIGLTDRRNVYCFLVLENREASRLSPVYRPRFIPTPSAKSGKGWAPLAWSTSNVSIC